MKKCPYCAEEIQDEAIKCRYCFSDLTVPPEVAMAQRPPAASASAASAGASAEPPAPSDPEAGPEAAPAASTSSEPQTTPWGTNEEPTPEPAATPTVTSSGTAQKYTHSGYRYVLGYGEDFFGIWDRQNPDVPTERFPRTDDGWRQAWLRFVAQEPNHVAVPDTMGGATTSPMTTPQTQPDPADNAVVQYTHTGTRYLLGYGRTFFGIWDRQNPATPVERFPRTDDGWGQAWRRYTQIESNFSEVGA